MTIEGNPGRLRIMTVLGFLVSSLALGTAFYLAWQKTHLEFAWALIVLFLFIIISTTSFTRKFHEGLITLTVEGIAIIAGFRTIPVAWDNLDAVEIIDFGAQQYLAIRLKALTPLAKLPQRFALINMEKTGFHFCLAGSLFKKPLPEICSLLSLYQEDENKRHELKPGN
jgi:hypothetical protein